MKKMTNIFLSILLAFVLCIPTMCLPAKAAGEVYTIENALTVFLSNEETVTVDETVYNTYRTLKEAIAALNGDEGVVVVCGEFTDATTNSDSTFADTSGRDHILITGLNKDGTDVLTFNHTLNFNGGPTTLENFKLNCSSTKYVFGSTEMVWGEGMAAGGNIYYGLMNNLKEVSAARTTFNSSIALKQYILSSGSNYAGTQAMTTPSTFEFVINDINKIVKLDLGFNNTANTVYGNINLFVNGGTFSDKTIILGNKETTVKGAVSAIFNNGISGFTYPETVNYVIESAEGGTVSIQTQAPYGGAPVFLLTPDEGLAPIINGSLCPENADGTYTLSPSAPTETTQEFSITWINAAEPESPIFYLIDGNKTAFLMNGGGLYEYNGTNVYAFDTLTNVYTANTDNAEVVVLAIGEITETLDIANNCPSHLIIKGIDDQAVLTSSSTIHTWTKTTIENISVNWTGLFAGDGNEFAFGEGLDSTFANTIYGGGSSSPHGGNLTFKSGTYTGSIYAGSDVATTNTTKWGNHAITIDGGDFSAAKLDGGSSATTDVPGYVAMTINGGTFASNQSIALSNIGTVNGIKAAIFNNGIYDTYNFTLDSGYDYVIKSESGGTVTFDGTNFVLTPDEDYAPIVNGELNISGVIKTGEPGEYSVTWIKSSGTASSYTIDGTKTAYVKTGGGLVSLDDDGTGMYAFSDIVSAIKAAVGGKVIVVGEFSGHTNSYWSGSGTTTICGYDSDALWTWTSTFYNWTPLVLKNIRINPNGYTLNADARKFTVGENVVFENSGFVLVGGQGSTDRAIDVTLNSGTYTNIRGGNTADVGSVTTPLYIYLTINGGDYSGATINAGNSSAKTLYGNLLTTIKGGTFAEGQSIALNNITVTGNSVIVMENGIADTYSLAPSENYNYVIKVKEGGTVDASNLGSDAGEPKFVFVPDDVLYAPTINGEQLSANAKGEFYYIPEESDTQTVLEIDWVLDTTPRVYNVEDALTVFVSSESTVVIDDATYYTFASLTEAVAALDGYEGVVILASDVTEEQFTDTANREKITIRGLNGDEIYTYNNTFSLLGDAIIDDITFNLTDTKYLYGYGELVFGENFTKTGSSIYLATNYNSRYFPSKTIINGGTFGAFHLCGAYSTIGEEDVITAEINGGSITNSLNLGYAEKQTASTNNGIISLIINADAVSTKTITYKTAKSPDGTSAIYTLVLANGLASTYTVDDDANAVVDYFVKSAEGGTVSIVTQPTSETAPVLLLTPNEGYIPMVGDDFVPTSSEGYIYTPELATSQVVTEITWVDESVLTPAVFEYNGENCTIVKKGGGVVKFDGENRFAYLDVNSALAALGTDGGSIYLYGTVYYENSDLTESTNKLTDVAGRSLVKILGIEGSSPRLEYYRNGNMEGDLYVDGFTYHRVDGELYDTGFLTCGHNLEIGEDFESTSDFSQVMTIHGSGSNITYADKSVVTIRGGNITRIVSGTTYSKATINGDTEINIMGGGVSELYAGNHGGQVINNETSVLNGNVDINVTGGSVGLIRTGSNSKGTINGNVTVRISADLTDAKLYHGSVTNTHPVNGNSVFIITEGNLEGTIIGNGSESGVTGVNAVVVSSEVEGYTYNHTDGHTFIVYDAEGNIDVAYNDDGSFAGWKITCDNTSKDILVDGIKLESESDDIYTIDAGKHTVLFSTYSTITFDINGAEGEIPESIRGYDGVVFTLPDGSGLEKFNHRFVGWSTDADALSGETTFVMPEEHITLYAIWEEIKPELAHDSNIENSNAESVVISSVSAEDYETTDFVVSALAYITEDAVINNGAEVCYAYKMRAYDKDSASVDSFEHGLNVRIPKHVLPERNPGENYRIYRIAPSAEVEALTSETAAIVAYTEDDEYLYYTTYETGDYVVLLANELEATYNYFGIYDAAQGKYTLTLTFSDAFASFGSFGLKYDSTMLTLDSFTFAEDVTDKGSTSVADGGFGTYYNEAGFYRNTWAAANGYGIDATTNAVKIGEFVFTTTEGFDISTLIFECATPDDIPAEIDESVIDTVHDTDVYLYAPVIDSTEVYCQPINSVFSFVSVSYILLRNASNSFTNDEQTGFNNRAVITITDSEANVFATLYEDELTVTEDENGYAVINVSEPLDAGTYTITFTKNGYVADVKKFEISTTATNLGNVVLKGGDIRDNFEDTHGDGVVDIDDFLRLLRGFSSSATTLLKETVDINEDGFVNVYDLSTLKAAMLDS